MIECIITGAASAALVFNLAAWLASCRALDSNALLTGGPNGGTDRAGSLQTPGDGM
jgi:hypothetical protein